jgi:hypothetical protein
MRTLLWLLAAALFGLAFAGCYTMLAHPVTDVTSGSGDTVRQCSDCHSSADYYYWHYPYYNTWSWRSPSWHSYYYEPWWWNNYWYWDDGDGGGTPREERDLWQPRTPPAGETPALPGTAGEKVKETPRSPGTGSQTSQETTKQETKKQEKQLFQPRKPAEKPKQDEQPEKKERKSKDE